MSDTPDLPEDLARELRERIGGEMRRAAEEGEYDARKAALRGRDLGLVAYEWMTRGDVVACHFGETVITGVVTHARADLVTIQTGGGMIADINLAKAPAFKVASTPAPGGRGVDPIGAPGFRARLLEIEMAAAEVELWAIDTVGQIRGRIEAVAKDHVMLVGADATWYVPIASIDAVLTA